MPRVVLDADLLQLLGAPADKARIYAPLLTDAANRFEINTPERLAHFIGQIGVESGGGGRILIHNRELASGVAYEGRHDLGNTQRGDGARFRGRGLIQLTGRANYTSFRDWLRSELGAGAPDPVTNPAVIEQPRYSVLASVWYWRHAKATFPCGRNSAVRRVCGDLSTLADFGVTPDVITAVSRCVNGCVARPNHLQHRIDQTQRAYRTLLAESRRFFPDEARERADAGGRYRAFPSNPFLGQALAGAVVVNAMSRPSVVIGKGAGVIALFNTGEAVAEGVAGIAKQVPGIKKLYGPKPGDEDFYGAQP